MTNPPHKSNPNHLITSKDNKDLHKNKSVMAYIEETTMKIISEYSPSTFNPSFQSPNHQKVLSFFQTTPSITVPTSSGGNNQSGNNHTPRNSTPVSPLPGFFVYSENIIQEGLQNCKRSF